MRSKIDGGRFQFLGRRDATMKRLQPPLGLKWRGSVHRGRRRHDPMLVFNMSIFNHLASGWDRTFNPFKPYADGAR